MFINLSNHPAVLWDDNQLNHAKRWGEIVDYKFPTVDAQASSAEVANMAAAIVSDILKMKPDVVMCQGEFTLSNRVVQMLLANGVKVVAACTERESEEYVDEDGTVRKISKFRFVQFREY